MFEINKQIFFEGKFDNVYPSAVRSAEHTLPPEKSWHQPLVSSGRNRLPEA